MSDDPSFDAAVALVLAHEGGFQCAPNDAGNWTGGRVGEGALRGTKYGISAASYPALDIAALTEDEARAIYRRDWWGRYGIGRLPPPFAAKALDACVNLGPGAGISCLQRALAACGQPVAADGRLGPETLAAVAAVPEEALLAAFRDALAAHYRGIAAGHPDTAAYLAGWLARAYA